MFPWPMTVPQLQLRSQTQADFLILPVKDSTIMKSASVERNTFYQRRLCSVAHRGTLMTSFGYGETLWWVYSVVFCFAVTAAPSDGETGRTHEDTFGVSFLLNDVADTSVNSATFRFQSCSSVLLQFPLCVETNFTMHQKPHHRLKLDYCTNTVKLPCLMSLKWHLLHFDLSFLKKKKHRIKNDINNTFAVCQVWAFQFPCWVYLLAGMAQSDV